MAAAPPTGTRRRRKDHGSREAGRLKGPAFLAAPTGTAGARDGGEIRARAKNGEGKERGLQAARFLRGTRREAWERRSEAGTTGGINSEAGWIQAGGGGAGRTRDKIEGIWNSWGEFGGRTGTLLATNVGGW
jgi:hypothetical protein